MGDLGRLCMAIAAIAIRDYNASPARARHIATRLLRFLEYIFLSRIDGTPRD